VIGFNNSNWSRARARLSTTLVLASSLFLVRCYQMPPDPQPSSPAELGVQCCATWRSECGRYEPDNRVAICAHAHATNAASARAKTIRTAGPETGVLLCVVRCEQDCLRTCAGSIGPHAHERKWQPDCPARTARIRTARLRSIAPPTRRARRVGDQAASGSNVLENKLLASTRVVDKRARARDQLELLKPITHASAATLAQARRRLDCGHAPRKLR